MMAADMRCGILMIDRMSLRILPPRGERSAHAMRTGLRFCFFYFYRFVCGFCYLKTLLQRGDGNTHGNKGCIP